MPHIELDGISKTFRAGGWKDPVPAVQQISLKVEQGTIFALLGTNGAGKSTLTRILLGLVRPDSGTIHIAHAGGIVGPDRIGYLPELFAAPLWMTGAEVVEYAARLGRWGPTERAARTHEALERTGLLNAASKRTAAYSKGMMQRLGLAQAILLHSGLLVLDEPTDGLDPVARRMVRELLLDLAGKGTTIWLTSHLLSEVEQVAGEVAILHQGKLLRTGPLQELVPRDRTMVEVSVPPPAGPWPFQRRGQGWSCIVEGGDALQQLLAAMQELHVPVLRVQPQQADLESFFFSTLTKENDDSTIDRPSDVS